MRCSAIGFIVLASLFYASPSSAVVGYIGGSISEYDLLGCQRNANNPRCKKVIQVACKSICFGHQEENTELGLACKEMCPQLVDKSIKDDKTPELQLLAN